MGTSKDSLSQFAKDVPAPWLRSGERTGQHPEFCNVTRNVTPLEHDERIGSNIASKSVDQAGSFAHCAVSASLPSMSTRIRVLRTQAAPACDRNGGRNLFETSLRGAF